jgi:toxin ParE2
MRYDFLTSARAELQEAIEFYDDRQPGLGQGFAGEIKHALASIQQSPTLWKKISGNVRRCRLRRFPYALIYHLQEDLILIVAVAHVRRHPTYWRNRLIP